jgi:signal transduction histidine kinase
MAADTTTKRKIISAVCVPIIVRERVIGTLNLNRTKSERPCFTENDLETCSVVASQAGIVIENHRLREELINKERLAAVGQTVASISHCIKNILSGVRGGLGLTEMGIRNNQPDMLRNGFEILKHNANTMSNLVLDLLDYSKERQPFRDTFPMDITVQRVVETLAHKAQALGVLIEPEIDGDINYFGDRDQIFRALLNLVSNAVEACGDPPPSSEKPRVIIRVKTESSIDCLGCRLQPGNSGPWMLIDVKDNGPGIPEDRYDMIWDLFYSTKGSKGTGIGLAASRKMVEEHGGLLFLQSSAAGATVFRMLLPMQTPDR